MNKTIIINRIINHYSNGNTKTKKYSNHILDLETDFSSYYNEKIEKTVNNDDLIEVFDIENQVLLSKFKELNSCSDDRFVEISKEFLNDFEFLTYDVIDLSNFNLIIADLKIDGNDSILIMKLNHIFRDVNKFEEDKDNQVIKIITNLVLPDKNKKVEEAILYDKTNDICFVLEKKHKEKNNYISKDYLKGYSKLSNKKTLTLIDKSIEEMIDTNLYLDNKEILDSPILKKKQYLYQASISNKDPIIYDMIDEIMETASEKNQIKDILEDNYIHEIDMISNDNLPKLNKISNCSLKLSNKMEIKLNINQLIDQDILIEKQENGTSTIIIKNVQIDKIK